MSLKKKWIEEAKRADRDLRLKQQAPTSGPNNSNQEAGCEPVATEKFNCTGTAPFGSNQRLRNRWDMTDEWLEQAAIIEQKNKMPRHEYIKPPTHYPELYEKCPLTGDLIYKLKRSVVIQTDSESYSQDPETGLSVYRPPTLKPDR